MSLVDDLAAAIERMESGGNPNSIAMRNNNPGNLRSWGSYPVVNGYVQFPDYATGLNALKAQIAKNIGRGLSLREFFGGKPGVYGGYAPAADANNPNSYAATVAGWLGVDADTPLSQIGGTSPPNPITGPLPREAGDPNPPAPGKPKRKTTPS